MKLLPVLRPWQAVTVAAGGVALGVSVLGAGLASPALAATPKPSAGLGGTPTPQTFAECPVNSIVSVPHVGQRKVSICLVGVASTGSFRIGNLTIDFHGPGTIQGGFNPSLPGSPPTWADPLDGQSFSAPRQLLPEPVLALLGNPAGITAPHANVYAVASQAAPIGFSLNVGSEITTTLTLPLKFHMVNSLLGNNCYIGTDADPIVLTLTTGTSGTLTGTLGSLNVFDNGKVLQTVGTEVVDGQFSVPAATGCGNGGVWDNAIDTTNALPSPSGSNAAMLFGTFDLASARWVKHQLGE